MFENFPYTDMHQLNLDWIVKIAKDFLEQYTHIQELITQGETDIENLSAASLESLQQKADELTTALNAWYEEHQDYLDDTLTAKIAEFNTAADAKAAQTIASIPADYTALANSVTDLINALASETPYPYFNLAKQSGWADNKVIDIATGNLTDNNSFISSSYIRVSPMHQYSGSFTNHVAFYDINFNFVGYRNQQLVFTVPEDVYFIRVDAEKTWRRGPDIVIVEGNYSLTELYLLQFYDINSFRVGNMFNPATVSEGVYVLWDQSLADNADFACSTFIPVSPNTQYVGNFTNHCTWFTAQLAPISSTNMQTQVTSPANARFVRFDFNTTKITADRIMFLEGTELPDEYVPYLIPLNFSFMKSSYDRFNPWDLKTWAAYGDSIVAISNGDGLDLGWAEYINDDIPFKMFYGRGIGGQTYEWRTAGGSVCFIDNTGNYVSRNDSYNKDNFPGMVPTGTTAVRGAMCSWDRITHMFPESIKNNINLIFLFAGSNDTYTATDPQWVYNSAVDPEWAASSYYAAWNGDYNIETLAGGLASTILKLQAWMPNALIVVGTPLNGRTDVPGGTKPQTIPPEYDKSIVILNVAKMFGCSSIDVFGECGINVLNSPTYITDGLHPYTDAGEKMIARTIIPRLNAIYPKQ